MSKAIKQQLLATLCLKVTIKARIPLEMAFLKYQLDGKAKLQQTSVIAVTQIAHFAVRVHTQVYL